MIINSCESATEIEKKLNLKTYAADRPCYIPSGDLGDTFDDYVSAFTFRSKVKTKDAGTPEYYVEHGESETYFTGRITTYGIATIGQVFRMNAQ